MKLTQSFARFSGKNIFWYLYAHRIEFTEEEFLDLVKNIKRHGLFSYLEKERPVLKEHLIAIIRSSVDASFWEGFKNETAKEKYIEAFLEQCLLEIYKQM